MVTDKIKEVLIEAVNDAIMLAHAEEDMCLSAVEADNYDIGKTDLRIWLKYDDWYIKV